MGSHIDLKSEVGVGSTFGFTLDLPMIPDKTQTQHQNSQYLADLPVLVVDDNATSRELMREMLLNWGMRPTVLKNAAEALAELAHAEGTAQRYELVVLDLKMPDMDGFELIAQIRARSRHSIPTVMMLTSEGHRGDAARCRELNIGGYVTKPVIPSDLFDAIMTVLGESSQLEPQAVTRHYLHASQRKLNLLLAEDNVVNQRLAVRLLEKQGHSVTIANNGREAVAGWQNTHFDAILMDVDMPIMNGYEATELIREQELSRGTHIPIIAMTAHAMQGVRETCLNHGMDSYLSKPIDTDALCKELDMLAQWGSQADVQAKSVATTVVVSKPMVVDFAAVRENMDYSRELFDEIVRLLLVNMPPQLTRIKDSAISGDVDAIRHGAHAIRGMVGIFAAERSMQAAAMLEHHAGEPNLAEKVAEMEAALIELKNTLCEYQW
jgi:CheY-like chemotaxis protein/HPt (histidine-containing phosphotransfer) domain-containing protein